MRWKLLKQVQRTFLTLPFTALAFPGLFKFTFDPRFPTSAPLSLMSQVRLTSSMPPRAHVDNSLSGTQYLQDFILTLSSQYRLSRPAPTWLISGKELDKGNLRMSRIKLESFLNYLAGPECHFISPVLNIDTVFFVLSYFLG